MLEVRERDRGNGEMGKGLERRLEALGQRETKLGLGKVAEVTVQASTFPGGRHTHALRPGLSQHVPWT